jgi:hypothetical protein
MAGEMRLDGDAGGPFFKSGRAFRASAANLRLSGMLLFLLPSEKPDDRETSSSMQPYCPPEVVSGQWSVVSGQ